MPEAIQENLNYASGAFAWPKGVFISYLNEVGIKTFGKLTQKCAFLICLKKSGDVIGSSKCTFPQGKDALEFSTGTPGASGPWDQSILSQEHILPAWP